MQYTVMGFDQKKMIELGIDVVDAAILRWFVDFYASASMEKHLYRGRSYGWVSYKHLASDIPTLGIRTAQGIAKRLKKYVEKGLLSSYLHDQWMTCFHPEKALDELRWDEGGSDAGTRGGRTGVGRGVIREDKGGVIRES